MSVLRWLAAALLLATPAGAAIHQNPGGSGGGGGGGAPIITSTSISVALGGLPAQRSANLSDLVSAALARSNLGLGTLATLNTLNGTQVSSWLGYTPADAAALTTETNARIAGLPVVAGAKLLAPGASGGTATVISLNGSLSLSGGVLSTVDSLTGDVTGTSSAGSTTTTLATVNSNTGLCGDATHVSQVTLDGKGRATACTPVAISIGGSALTGLTGDITASGPGSAAATLATVNGNVGACGDATHVGRATFDAKGRATGCSAVTITSAANDVTSLTGDVTGSGPGATATTLAAVNANVGLCGDATHVSQVTFDAKGRATSCSPIAITSGSTALTSLTGDVTASGPGAAATTLATVNANTGLCGDATHVSQVTFDAKGRATACAPVLITSGSAALTSLTGDATASGPGAGALSLATVNPSVGLCGDATHVSQVTLDAKGRATACTPVSIGFPTPGIATLTGDLNASGSGTVTGTLATVNANVGLCGDATHSSQVTLDGKGRVLSCTAVTIAGTGGAGITAITGDLAASGSGSVVGVLPTVNSNTGACGDATHVGVATFDGKGRATGCVPIAITGGAIALTSLSGDITATGPGAVAGTLAVVNSAVGSCGDATHVGQVTLDAKGRATGCTPVAITTGTTPLPVTPVAYTTSNTIAAGVTYAVGNSASAISLALPACTAPTAPLTIKRYGAGQVTITGAIDGGSTPIVMSSSAVKESVTLTCWPANSTWLS